MSFRAMEPGITGLGFCRKIRSKLDAARRSRERGFVTLRTTACFCGSGTASDQQGWLWLDQSYEGLPPAAGRSESYGGHAVRPAPRATHGRLPPQHYPFQRVLDGFRSWRGARACVDQPLNYTPDDACPRSAAPCFTLGAVLLCSKLARCGRSRAYVSSSACRQESSTARWTSFGDGYRFTSHKITLSTTLMMSEVISGK